MPDGVTLTTKWNLNDIYRQWAAIKRRSDDAASFYVRFQSRMLIRALAWHTTIAEVRTKLVRFKTITDKTGHRRVVPLRHPRRIRIRRGRARAGWRAAAVGLGVNTVYTKYQHRSVEGALNDQSKRKTNPMVVMTNRVPYVGRIVGIQKKLDAAVAQQRAKALQHLERSYRRAVGTGAIT